MFEIIECNEKKIAKTTTENIVIASVQDALDFMANASYNGAGKIIWHEQNLAPEFFDLKTKLAGEILQKFSNYRVQLAIVGDFSKYTSKSLRDFIYECNKYSQVCFVDSFEEAMERLGK